MPTARPTALLLACALLLAARDAAAAETRETEREREHRERGGERARREREEPKWTAMISENHRRPGVIPKPAIRDNASPEERKHLKNARRASAPPPSPPPPPPAPYPPPSPPIPDPPPPPPYPHVPRAAEGAGISGTNTKERLLDTYAQYRESRKACSWQLHDQGSKASYERWARPDVWAAGKHAALKASTIRGEVVEYVEYGFANTSDYIKAPEMPYNVVEAQTCLVEDASPEAETLSTKIRNGRPGAALNRVQRPTWGITRIGPIASTGGGQWHRIAHVFDVGFLRQWASEAAEESGRITALYMNPVTVPKTEIGPGGLAMGGHGSNEDATYTHYVENPPLAMHECKLYDGAGRRGDHLLASWGPDASCAKEDGGHACSMRLLPEGVGLDVRWDSGGVKMEECFVMDMREPNADQMAFYLEVAIRVETVWYKKSTTGSPSIGGTNLVFTNPPNPKTAPYEGVVTPSGSRLNPSGPAIRRPIWPSMFRNPDPYTSLEIDAANAGGGPQRAGFWRDQSVLGKSLAPSVYWYSAPLKVPAEGSTIRSFHPHAFDPNLVVSVMLFLAKPIELGLPWTSHDFLNVTDALRFTPQETDKFHESEYFGHGNHDSSGQDTNGPPLDGEPMLYDRFRLNHADLLGLGDFQIGMPTQKLGKKELRRLRQTATDWGVAEYVALAPVSEGEDEERSDAGAKKESAQENEKATDESNERPRRGLRSMARRREEEPEAVRTDNSGQPMAASRSPVADRRHSGWAREGNDPARSAGADKEATGGSEATTTEALTTTTTRLHVTEGMEEAEEVSLADEGPRIPGVEPKKDWEQHSYQETRQVNLDSAHYDEARHDAAYKNARKKLMSWLESWKATAYKRMPPPPPAAPPKPPNPTQEEWLANGDNASPPPPPFAPPESVAPSDAPKLLCEWFPTFETVKQQGGSKQQFARSFEVAHTTPCDAARVKDGDHITVVAFLRPRPRKSHEEMARSSGMLPHLSALIEPGRWVNELSVHMLVHPNRQIKPKRGGTVAPGLCITHGACS